MKKNEKSAVEPLLLNFKQAAPIVGLTVWQIRALASSGDLPVVRVGKHLYVRRRTLERFVESAESRHRTMRRRSSAQELVPPA
jgi:excisionase family DNA binding protein